MTDMKNEMPAGSRSKPVSIHRLVSTSFWRDGTGVAPEDFDLFDDDRSGTPEEQGRHSGRNDNFDDFQNDSGRAMAQNASFRLFKRGNRLMSAELVRKGWWRCRYFAPRRVRRRKNDQLEEKTI